MTGRLELDDSGRVVGSADDPVDLGAAVDPAVDPVVASPGWLHRTAGPVVRRHPRAMRAAGLGLLAGTLVLGWWAGRTPAPPPAAALDLSSAVLPGTRTGAGGPEVTPDGVLRVAFAAQAPTGSRVVVTGLVGPGLGTSSVSAPAVPDDDRVRVEARAPVLCTDPALRTARADDYGLTVTATSPAGESVAGTVALVRTLPGGRDASRVDLAVGAWCLERATVEVRDVAATAVPGVPLADLAVRVRNTGPVPVLVATGRTTGLDLDVDLSPDTALDPGEDAVLRTRAILHACASTPRPPDGEVPGLTLLLRSGGAAAQRSAPLPGGADLGRRVAATVCAGAPRATASITEVRRVATTPGSWRLEATLAVRTEGIGVRVGRERFLGPAAGEGSILGVVDGTEPASPWDVGPARLDGGAGRIAVALPGGRCEDLDRLTPGELPWRVLTADGRVYPFALPLDDVRLVRAAYAGCGLEADADGVLLDRGWPGRLRGLPGGLGA